MEYDFSELKTKLDGTIAWLGKEYQGLRTGRATPTLLDSIMVDAYGSRSPLKQVANVATEDARTLRVSPFDASLIKDVERAIAAADLGVGTSVADTSVRVTFPELTGERRSEIIKVAKHKLEEARKSVRALRDDVWSDVQKKEKDGEISEDDKFRIKDELQKSVDGTNNSLESIFNKKEQEISA